nr:hypothetical protein [Tanacetum cinerariifolium]
FGVEVVELVHYCPGQQVGAVGVDAGGRNAEAAGEAAGQVVVNLGVFEAHVVARNLPERGAVERVADAAEQCEAGALAEDARHRAPVGKNVIAVVAEVINTARQGVFEQPKLHGHVELLLFFPGYLVVGQGAFGNAILRGAGDARVPAYAGVVVGAAAVGIVLLVVVRVAAAQRVVAHQAVRAAQLQHVHHRHGTLEEVFLRNVPARRHGREKPVAVGG